MGAQVEDRGGPLFVRRPPGSGQDWWPTAVAADQCVVSFVLALTREAMPFLMEEEEEPTA